MITIRTLKQLKPVLKDPHSEGSGEIYYAVRPESGAEYGKEPNITIIPPGRLGEEFPKTFGHYHLHNEPETYRFLYGTGIVLIQHLNTLGRVDNVKALWGIAGKTVKVPHGFGHALINASDDLLITADWESNEARHEYSRIRAKKGMAYYVVDNEGRIEYEKNPNYSHLPAIEIINA